MITGQFAMVFRHIEAFQSADAYRYISRRQEELDAEIIRKANQL
jgi:hypothetical protein